jgi:hypothetical protein
MDGTMQQFTARYSTNRKRGPNDPSYTFDVLSALGVCVTLHDEHAMDEEGERVACVACGGQRWSYAVPARALVRVLLCVPPSRFAYLEDCAVATAMLMHGKFGSNCALSHLDDITKDALLRMIVGNSKQNMTLTAVYFQPDCGEQPEDPVELQPGNPHEVPSPLQFDYDDTTPCFWIVRDEQNKTVVELMFYNTGSYKTVVELMS